MGSVVLRKKVTTSITEENNENQDVNVNIIDPNIKAQVAQFKDKIDKAAQRYNAEISNYKTQIDALIKKDAEAQKKAAVQNAPVSADASVNTEQTPVTESYDRIYRKACRLSKRLYESAKSKKADLSVELIDLFADMDLSYTLNQDECDRLSRKIIDVLDNKLSSKADKNQWPDVVSEIKKYFKNNSISLSSSEKTKVCDAIEDCITKMPEYDWVFGSENKDLSDRINGYLSSDDEEIRDDEF